MRIYNYLDSNKIHPIDVSQYLKDASRMQSKFFTSKSIPLKTEDHDLKKKF
jgi:hypothetical protein